MMKSNQHPISTKFFAPVRSWLLGTIAINIAFVGFVATATQGSLSLYTTPHAIVALLSLGILFTSKASKSILYVALTVSTFAVLVAIFLVLAFASYYQNYVDYQRSLSNKGP